MPVHYKPQRKVCKTDDHDNDYNIPPHLTVETEVDCIELRQRDETLEDREKDYYFMDTTLLGQF